jgi:recombinational DNA repair protein (RecF pathway)
MSGAAASGSVTCEALVLRKTPFSETSLILYTLTRTAGQQHFLLKGARRHGRRAFPEADLMRRVEIVYRPARQSTLHTAREVTCVVSYDRIAQRPAAFAAAGWLCRFALENTVGDAPAPELYAALELAFARLSEPAPLPPRAIVLGVCFVALAEHGVLPELADQAHLQAELARMTRFALTATEPLPPYPAASWDDLHRWMRSYLPRAGLRLAAGWDDLA